MSILSLISPSLLPASLQPPSSPFEPPSPYYTLLSSPLTTILWHIHAALVQLRGAPYPTPTDPLRIVCISDTHTHTPDLPAGDLLIHAGDLTNRGDTQELQAQLSWLSAQPHTHVVCIAGNHDSYFDPSSRRAEDTLPSAPGLDFGRVRYLQHGGTTLTFKNPASSSGTRSIKVHGAPQIPACGGPEHAFQYERGEDAWSGTVPEDVDVLVTHTPPKWHRDLGGVGCEWLLGEAWRVRPRLHVFGHVHGGRGREVVFWGKAQEAWERVAERKGVWDWFGVRPWADALRVLVWGLVGVVWTRVWGVEGNATEMVNAGLVDWRNRLVHEPQMVVI